MLSYAILFFFALTQLKLVFRAKFCTKVYVIFRSMEIVCMNLMINLDSSQILGISFFASSKTDVCTPEERPFYFAYGNRNFSFPDARFKDYKLKRTKIPNPYFLYINVRVPELTVFLSSISLF